MQRKEYLSSCKQQEERKLEPWSQPTAGQQCVPLFPATALSAATDAMPRLFLGPLSPGPAFLPLSIILNTLKSGTELIKQKKGRSILKQEVSTLKG